MLMSPTRIRKPIARRDARLARFGSRRSGAAGVEAAFCFPIIIIIMMGTLEICSGIYLKESVSICAFEGCRVGCRRGATRDTVMDRLVEVLRDREITLPTKANGEPEGVEIIPNDFSTLCPPSPMTTAASAVNARESPASIASRFTSIV